MLILDDPNTWPRHIVDQLEKEHIKKLLQSYTSIESMVEYVKNFANEDPGCWDIIDIFADVDKYVKSNSLCGFHCTKELPERPYKKTGLRILDLEPHHAEFLKLIRDHPLFNKKLYRYINQKLRVFRNDPVNIKYREKTLHFCLTRKTVGFGTDELFGYYGGEAVYDAFPEDMLVRPLLEKLGEPVVIEANMDVNAHNLTIHPKTIGDMKFYFGPTVVENFAYSINREFYVTGLQGHATFNIEPGDIVSVHPYEDFKKKWLL